jgi:solute carrier family 25 protein 16
LTIPTLNNIGTEKDLAIEARDTILEILVYDEEEETTEKEDARTTSEALGENLLETWLGMRKAAIEENDEHTKFVEKQVRAILIAFGKKRPKVWTLDLMGRQRH